MKINANPILFASLVAAITGCSPDTSTRPGGQVAAVVNGDEISIHQVNAALAYVSADNATDGERLKRIVLDRLVQQQLLVQKAREEQLDRKPQVMQAIESAKAQVLARAYLQRVAADVADPSAEDVDKFVRTHPALFSKRRIYKFEQLLLDKTVDASQVRTQLRKDNGVKELMSWLKQEHVAFKSANVIAKAEQLSLDVLSIVKEMKDGQTTVVERPDGTLVIRLIASRQQPIPDDKRVDAARRYMLNQAQRKAAAAELQKLVHSAHVEYADGFVEQGNDAKAVAYMEKAPKVEQDDDAFSGPMIDEGLKGLK